MNALDCLNHLGNELHVRVIPRASANKIKLERQSDGSTRIRVYTTAIPEDNKANKAVIKILAKALDLPRSSLTITHGSTSRDKIIHIQRSCTKQT